MNVSDNLKRDLEAGIGAFTASFMAIQQQTVIDGLDCLFESFSEWGIPAEALLMGIQTGLENHYGFSITKMKSGGTEE